MAAADHLLSAIDRLRGYRCAEQRVFLNHVESVGRKTIIVLDERARYREALEWIYAEPEDTLKVQERARQALHPDEVPDG